jgi:hypothetical protein
MSRLAEVAVDKATFGIAGHVDGTEMLVALRGHADTQSKPELDRFLNVMASEATRLHVRRVKVDLSKVEFMNSSCIKGFVNWIGEIQELPADRQYHIHFVSDGAAQWQRRTLQALMVFGGDLIELA